MTDTIYSPLNATESSFRLVFIHPAPCLEDDVVCSLETFVVVQAPPFEALSYCWGDPKIMQSIKLQDIEYNVTENLAAALRHLRRTNGPRVVWIDAICINQSDTVEKNHQVPLMRLIYESASTVVAWLGEEEHADESEAFELINTLENHDLHWDTEATPTNSDLMRISIFLSIMRILTRPWWMRVWTIQETILARDLIFVLGRSQCSYKAMISLATSFFTHTNHCCKDYQARWTVAVTVHRDLYRPMSEILDIKSIQENLDKLGSSELVGFSRHRVATVTHDYAYGFFGLIDQSGPVDYNKPVENAFVVLALSLIALDNNLNVLSHKFGDENGWRRQETYDLSSLSLPSWCPNWSLRPRLPGSHHYNRRLKDLESYNASAGLPLWIAAIVEDDNYLPVGPILLRGFSLDTVHRVGNVRQLSWESNDKTFEEWYQLVIERQSSVGDTYCTGESCRDAFWMTLCAGILHPTPEETSNMPAWEVATPQRRIFFETWATATRDKSSQIIQSRSGSSAASASDPVEDSIGEGFLIGRDLYVDSFHTRVSIATVNRKFFITEKGYFGLGPSTTQPGDNVCVLAGGHVPYVVRPRDCDCAASILGDEPVNSLELLGDAYIQGIMNGEIAYAEEWMEEFNNLWEERDPKVFMFD